MEGEETYEEVVEDESTYEGSFYSQPRYPRSEELSFDSLDLFNLSRISVGIRFLVTGVGESWSPERSQDSRVLATECDWELLRKVFEVRLRSLCGFIEDDSYFGPGVFSDFL